MKGSMSLLDVFSSRAVHTPGMDFEGAPGGEVDFTSGSFLAFLGRKQLPGDWTWVPAFRYQYASLDLSTSPFGGAAGAPDLEADLHSAVLHQVLLRTPKASDWMQGIYLGTGINSDFDSVDRSDLLLAAAAGATYRFNDHFTAGLAVYGGNLLNDPFVVPGPIFFWTPSPDWLITYFGPRFDARRELGDKIRLGFEASWNGGWWGVESFGSEARLQVNSLRTGLYYHHRVHPNLWLEVGAGYTFANEIDVFSRTGNDLSPGLMGDAEPAPYIMAGLRIHRW
jgi:hypothetical protein